MADTVSKQFKTKEWAGQRLASFHDSILRLSRSLISFFLIPSLALPGLPVILVWEPLGALTQRLDLIRVTFFQLFPNPVFVWVPADIQSIVW